jgi:hypothetical protein
VTSKVENLVFYKHETAVLFAERFAEKFFFLVSSTKLAAVVQEIPFDHCVEGQDNIQQRSMTYVWKCKRTSSSVA